MDNKGYNKAILNENLKAIIYEAFNEPKPCVFLSHKFEDKAECRKIAEYLKEAEINFYLDELDRNLQEAVLAENPKLITEALKKGIRESTHMLVVVSEKTFLSKWVPFEIGYGHAAIVDNPILQETNEDNINLSILVLKDISNASLPDYMQIANIIRGITSLNNYISQISNKSKEFLLKEDKIQSHYSDSHPLADILNWKL